MDLKESGINDIGYILPESIRKRLDYNLFKLIKSQVAQTCTDPTTPNILYISQSSTYVISLLTGCFPNGVINCLQVDSSSEDMENNRSYHTFSSMERLSAINPKPINIVLIDSLLYRINDDIGFLKWLCTFEIINCKTVLICNSPTYHLYFNAEDLHSSRKRRYTERLLIHQFNRAGLEVFRSGYFLFSLIPQSLVFKIFVKRLISHSETKMQKLLLHNMLVLDDFFMKLLHVLNIKLKGAFCFVIAKKV